jgi:hypothetical protein
MAGPHPAGAVAKLGSPCCPVKRPYRYKDIITVIIILICGRATTKKIAPP